eukprot:978321-Pleurochrysis_carterae.AAC.2
MSWKCGLTLILSSSSSAPGIFAIAPLLKSACRRLQSHAASGAYTPCRSGKSKCDGPDMMLTVWTLSCELACSETDWPAWLELEA